MILQKEICLSKCRPPVSNVLGWEPFICNRSALFQCSCSKNSVHSLSCLSGLSWYDLSWNLSLIKFANQNMSSTLQQVAKSFCQINRFQSGIAGVWAHFASYNVSHVALRPLLTLLCKTTAVVGDGFTKYDVHRLPALEAIIDQPLNVFLLKINCSTFARLYSGAVSQYTWPTTLGQLAGNCF